AGTDIREEQLSFWHKISPRLQTAIQDMVAALPVNRPSSLQAVLTILCNLTVVESEPKPKPESSKENSGKEKNGFIRSRKPEVSRSRKKQLWIIGSVVFLCLALYGFLTSGPPLDSNTDSEDTALPTHHYEHDQNQDVPPDTVEVVSPWADSVSDQTAVPVSSEVEVPFVDSARIWISNCSGTPEVEVEFRAGTLSRYSYVYPLIGTSIRQTSVLLARRSDPSLPLSGTPLGQAAYQIADTSFAVKPVDLTIMLGTDLSYAGVNSQFLHSPVSPAGTLFVDVVNHGIQYSLEGMGAATWFAGRIDGKSCDIEDSEWLIVISDIRDADRFSEEIGIPELLEETLFLFKESNSPASTLEILLRQFFQALPPGSGFPLETIPIPDIHLLISSSFSG
ncbi:MAG: hypothetical protein GY852_10545, partial [bacterium]|nr:hypothetical protein [bacterium]